MIYCQRTTSCQIETLQYIYQYDTINIIDDEIIENRLITAYDGTVQRYRESPTQKVIHMSPCIPCAYCEHHGGNAVWPELAYHHKKSSKANKSRYLLIR